MQQKIATMFVVLLTLGLLAVVVFGSKKQLDNQASLTLPEVTAAPQGNRQTSPPPENQVELFALNKPIFFYGNVCPHCLEVEEWMEANNVEEKLGVLKLEVYDNKQNAQSLGQAAASCGLTTNSIGVPFLFANQQCFVGTDEVMKYLSDTLAATGQQTEEERQR